MNTRLESYKLLDNVSQKQKQILKLLRKEGQLTAYQIANILGWKSNSTVPRVNELKFICAIEICETVLNYDTKRYNNVYRVINNHDERQRMLKNKYQSLSVIQEKLLIDLSYQQLFILTKELINKELKRVKKDINTLKRYIVF